MRTGLWILLCLMLLAFAVGPARADQATPWVSETKVGDVQTAEALVLATNPEGTAYGVLVCSDSSEWFCIPATVAKGVVDPAALGRPVSVKARITRRLDARTVTLEILEVKVIQPRRRE